MNYQFAEQCTLLSERKVEATAARPLPLSGAPISRPDFWRVSPILAHIVKMDPLVSIKSAFSIGECAKSAAPSLRHKEMQWTLGNADTGRNKRSDRHPMPLLKQTSKRDYRGG